MVKVAHLARSPRRRGPAFFWTVPKRRRDPQLRVLCREADLSPEHGGFRK